MKCAKCPGDVKFFVHYEARDTQIINENGKISKNVSETNLIEAISAKAICVNCESVYDVIEGIVSKEPRQ